VVGRQNLDIADTLHLRDVATANNFWLSIICGAHGNHLANMTTVRVRRRCGLMSNYFDHMFTVIK